MYLKNHSGTPVIQPLKSSCPGSISEYHIGWYKQIDVAYYISEKSIITVQMSFATTITVGSIH